MYQITADNLKNRLYIEIGHLQDINELFNIVKEIKEKCTMLEEGFSCITDLRKYEEIPDKEYEKIVLEVQKALVDAGLGKVVRIVKRFYIFGHMQLNNLSVKVGYHARNVTSMEEAEKLLDKFAGNNNMADFKKAV